MYISYDMIGELAGRQEEGGKMSSSIVMTTLYFVISTLDGIESSYG